jgi:regulator of protease activity HflC (stomatin/prohibitin superfamily)
MEAQQIAQRYKEAAAEEAETTKIRINAIEAAAGKLSEPALNYLYLQTLKEVADGRSSKLIFPMEFTKMAQNLSSGLGGKESGLEKLVEQIKK